MTTLNVDLSYDRPSVLRILSRALAEIADANERELTPTPVAHRMVQIEDGCADEVLPDEGPNYAAMKDAAPKRERGKPSPGKARRTKEEIAEDDAADKADAAAAPAEPKPAISTGEERIDPTDEAVAGQDAADEAAEVPSAPELTHDDVRAALKKYVDAYGMPAAMEDGPKVFTMLFGEKAVKVSDIPTDQPSLKRAVDGVLEMLAKNPFKREANL